MTKGGKVDLSASSKDIFTPGEMLIVLRVCSSKPRCVCSEISVQCSLNKDLMIKGDF